MGKRKYFMAIVLRGDAFVEAELIKQHLFERFGLRGALRSPAHITLHRPFEWKEEKESELLTRLATFKSLSIFDVELTGFGSFSERVAFIAVRQNEPLTRLHADLKRFAKQELGLLNEWEDGRGFHPHVTVAFRDLRKKNFYDVWQFLENLKFSHMMSVKGFSLLRLDDRWHEVKQFDLAGGR